MKECWILQNQDNYTVYTDYTLALSCFQNIKDICYPSIVGLNEEGNIRYDDILQLIEEWHGWEEGWCTLVSLFKANLMTND